MKFLKYFLILTVLVKSSFGGSQSYCDSLSKDFITLYQNCELIIDEIVSFYKRTSTATPVMSNGFAYSLGCKLDWMLVLLSNGTSRLTGTNLNIIEAILYGHISPPFPAPLDCLQDFLIAFRDKLNIAKSQDVVNIKQNFVAAAPSNSSCLDLQINVMAYYGQLANVIQPKVFDFLGLVSTFKDINMLDLYENYINSQVICDIEAVAVGIADMVNGSQDEAIAYADGILPQLSHPLNCVAILIESGSNLINTTYVQITTKVQSAQNLPPSASLNCGSYEESMTILKAGVFNIFNRIANYTLYNSFNHPDLIPAYISDSNCKIYNILYVISQVLSVSTNIEWYGILGTLLGFSDPPFEEPLNCIANDLMAIQARAHYLMHDFSESLNRSFAASSAFDNTSCDGLKAGMDSYNDTIYSFINDAVAETIAEAQTLNSFGMLDAFMNNIQNIRYCEINALSIMSSYLLNGDYQTSFKILDESTPAEYPFLCVQDIMLDIANHTNHLYENLVANFTGSSIAFP